MYLVSHRSNVLQKTGSSDATVAAFYDSAFEPLEEAIKQQLLQLSPATIDRILKPIRLNTTLKGLSGTKPGTLLATKSLFALMPGT